VKNTPPAQEGELTHHLVRNKKNNKTYVSKYPSNTSKEAVLRYKLLKQSKDYYLLEIDLKTGRHHQIRAQLSAIGCPIKGDLKYGFPRSNPDASVSLHSRKVSFIHPVSHKLIEIIAPPPKDPLWDFFAKV
jgi:23S rRNA pseudouridine1911/1915/1917 synthase